MVIQFNDDSHLIIKLSEYSNLLQSIDFLQKEVKKVQEQLEKYKEDNSIVFVTYEMRDKNMKKITIESDHKKLQDILNKSTNKNT